MAKFLVLTASACTTISSQLSMLGVQYIETDMLAAMNSGNSKWNHRTASQYKCWMKYSEKKGSLFCIASDGHRLDTAVASLLVIILSYLTSMYIPPPKVFSKKWGVTINIFMFLWKYVPFKWVNTCKHFAE